MFLSPAARPNPCVHSSSIIMPCTFSSHYFVPSASKHTSFINATHYACLDELYAAWPDEEVRVARGRPRVPQWWTCDYLIATFDSWTMHAYL